MNCTICGSKTIVHSCNIYDDRYGYPGEFTLMRCESCGHIQLQAAFLEDQITALYSTYYPRSSFNVDTHCPHQEKVGTGAWLDGIRSSAFRWVPREVRVLDIGCGFGETLGYHQARGCEVYGVETDENIRRVAERYGYKVHVGLFDANLYEPGFFDYVTMDQVFEHLQNPIEVMEGIAQVLKPGGVAILSLPNAHGWGARLFGRYWINWHAPYHLQFFSKNSMRITAEQTGLVVQEIKTITNSEWLFYQSLHLVTYPKLGNPSCFWLPNKASRTFIQKLCMKLLSLIHKTKINHLLTRLFDSIGHGDDFVCVLKKP